MIDMSETRSGKHCLLAEMSKVSVIVPVHQKSESLADCLAALQGSSYYLQEIIVCDQSTGSENAPVARNAGVRYLVVDRSSGAAATRNTGSRVASGDLLVFVDSDVVVAANTIEMLVSEINKAHDIGAVFGAYSPYTPHRNFASVYKNLYHCYTHRCSPGLVSSFWTGCGCVRKDVFELVAGFDESYTFCGVEDIDLGRRICEIGYKVISVPSIHVVHLKRRTLRDVIWFDMAYTARRWARMIVSTGCLRFQLNTTPCPFVSLLCAYAALGAACAATFAPYVGGIVAACLIFFVWLLNIRFLVLLARHGGWHIVLFAAPFLFFFYVYAGLGAAAGVISALKGCLRISGHATSKVSSD